jgi:hypothetical protein
MNRKAIVITLMYVLAALSVVACGGSSGGSGSAPEASSQPTKAEFVAQANAMCKVAEKRRSEILKKAVGEHPEGQRITQSDQELLLKQVVRPFEQMAGRFAEMVPPRGEEAKIRAIGNALRDSFTKVQSDPESGLNGTGFKKYDELVIAYGLSSCVI